MPGIDWRESMSVGVKVIDDQHKQLIDTISQLNEAIIAKKVDKELNGIFARLYDYILFHFATEEKYFDEFNYEESKEHKAAHLFFANRVIEMQDKVDHDSHALSLELIAFLEFWLVGHVMVMDQKYVECFHKNGLR